MSKEKLEVKDLLDAICRGFASAGPVYIGLPDNRERRYGTGNEECNRCLKKIQTDETLIITIDQEGEFYTHLKCLIY